MQVIANLWRIIDKSGLGKSRVLDIARQEGIIMDGLLMPLQVGGTSSSATTAHQRRSTCVLSLCVSRMH